MGSRGLAIGEPPPPGRPGGSLDDLGTERSRGDLVASIEESLIEITGGLSDCAVPVLSQLEQALPQAATLVTNAIRANLLAVRRAAG